MNRFALVLVWSFIAMTVYSQYNLSGLIADDNRQPLPGANLQIVGLGSGSIASRTGAFIIQDIPAGNYILMISFVGYATRSEFIDMSADLDLGTLLMERIAIMGEEAMVKAVIANSKTPVAYTGISREEIRHRNFGQDIPFLLSSTPSLVTSSDAGHGIGYTSMRIRGTDANRINVTINGIPLNDAESHSVYWVDLPDIATSVDHIQIQRGVGTSTNGAAAFGASVNFQTRKLEQEPYARYDGIFGSFHTMRNAISAGTGLIREHFAVDMRLSEIHSDGYIDRSWTDLRSYYGSAGYFDSRTIIKFITFSGTEELYQAWNGVPSYLLDDNRTYNELGSYTDEQGNQQFYDNQVDHYRQNHFQLHLSRSLNHYFHLNAALHYTRGAGYYEQYKENQVLGDYLLADVITTGDTIRKSDLVRRKWLQNDFYGLVGALQYESDRLSAILGGGWNHYAGDHFGTVIWARNPGISEIRHRWYTNTGSKSDWNSYAKATLDLGSNFSLFTDIQIRGIDYAIEGADDDLREISQDHQYLFFNPKAGLNLEMTPGQKFYLFVARANREPNRSNFVDADPAGPQPVKESLMDYEAGYSFQREQFRADVNLYYMDYTDQLVLTGEINDVGSAIMTNVSDSYRAGLEISGEGRLNSFLEWGLNVTLSRNKILDYSGYVDNWDYWSDPTSEPYQIVEDLGTTDLAFSPSVIFNSNIIILPVRHMRLELITRYVGAQFIDNTSSDLRLLDPYLVNDFRISYAFYPHFFEELSFQLKLANLFDVEYETNAWVYRYYSGSRESNFDGYYPQAGRHLMAGISLSF